VGGIADGGTPDPLCRPGIGWKRSVLQTVGRVTRQDRQARPLRLKADPGAGVSTRAERFDDHRLRPADLRREGLYRQPGLLCGRRREREQLRCFTGTEVSGLVNAPSASAHVPESLQVGGLWHDVQGPGASQ